MTKIARFGILLIWFLLTDLTHSFIGASYLTSLIIAVLTLALLFIPPLKNLVKLDAIGAGIVILVTSALGVLFLRDNVITSRSVTSLLVHIGAFVLIYFLFQSRLEREQ